MIMPTSFRLPQYLVDKVSQLTHLLKTEKQKYEAACISVEDKLLRDSMRFFTTKSNQYICELTSHLKSAGAVDAIDLEESNEQLTPHTGLNYTHFSSNIIQFFKDSEKMLISAYRAVLNEPYLVEELRTLVREQLNGIMYAFLQLKLLHKLRTEL
jgi:hypothetical protein